MKKKLFQFNSATVSREYEFQFLICSPHCMNDHGVVVQFLQEIFLIFDTLILKKNKIDMKNTYNGI